MKTLLVALAAVGLTACSQAPEQTVKVYAWQSENDQTTEQTLQNDFSQWHAHGINGMCYNAGHDMSKIQRAAKAAHANGMEYHAWIPAMLQHGLDSTLYAVNRNGESAYTVQAYVPYYKCLCPNQEGTVEFLTNLYGQVADIPEVDYVHLDYIRYVDVILARGLWEKYGLVMDKEYPTADYCYCDKCVADFKEATGIDIKSVEDPATCKEWAQFRCDLITKLVGEISQTVHAKGKKVSAAVFPGPDSHARWMVRQEWNKWDVDEFFPMNYNDFYLEPASWLATIVKEEVESVQGQKPVVSGLFICKDWKNKANIKDPEGHGLLPNEIEEAVRGSMESGAAGVALFTPDNMTEEHWVAFDKAIHTVYQK
ncbi:MAG: hypothetical protein ACI30I_04810 [Parabacteroides sp.]